MAPFITPSCYSMEGREVKNTEAGERVMRYAIMMHTMLSTFFLKNACFLTLVVIYS